MQTKTHNTPTAKPRDWRCNCCDKLLGKRRDDRVHVQFTRGHQYLASLPVSAVCRSCGTLNAIRS